jgi:transposase-like protein
VAARDPEGLAEKEKRKRAELESVPARQYKARHRSSLSAAEQQEIVEAYADQYVPQKEVARRFRVSPQLVGSLVRDSKKKPEKLRAVKEKEKRLAEEKRAIQSAIAGMQRSRKLISSAKVVQDEVQGSSSFEVSTKLVRQVLRQDCQLGFVRAKKFYPQANSARCRVLRQQYALEMFKLLEQGKRVVNIDETWLNETTYVRRAWAPKDGSSNVPLHTVTPRLSMIAALDTDGRVWFALAHANSDSNMMALFLLELTKLLDAELPGW